MKIIKKETKEDIRARKQRERELKIAEREEKKAEREQKKQARLEKKELREAKLRIQKLPAKKMTPAQVKTVLTIIDPDEKFSAKKTKSVSARIKQIGDLKPGVISNRLRARQAQVNMIQAIFTVVTGE
jgi:hypothetical protein